MKTRLSSLTALALIGLFLFLGVKAPALYLQWQQQRLGLVAATDHSAVEPYRVDTVDRERIRIMGEKAPRIAIDPDRSGSLAPEEPGSNDISGTKADAICRNLLRNMGMLAETPDNADMPEIYWALNQLTYYVDPEEPSITFWALSYDCTSPAEFLCSVDLLLDSVSGLPVLAEVFWQAEPGEFFRLFAQGLNENFYTEFPSSYQVTSYTDSGAKAEFLTEDANWTLHGLYHSEERPQLQITLSPK